MASRPIAPVPAHPSRKVAPSTRAPRMLNTVSRSLSLVGRMPGGGVPLSRRLLNFPEMIRMGFLLLGGQIENVHKVGKDVETAIIPSSKEGSLRPTNKCHATLIRAQRGRSNTCRGF